MGSPYRGWSLRCGRTHSIEMKVFFSEPCSKILRDEVTLWVKWVVGSHLIMNEGFLLVVR